MKPAWEEKVVLLHPLIVTGIFTILFVGSGLVINLLGFSFWAPAMLVMTTPLILWHYSLYRVTAARIAIRSGAPSKGGFWFSILAVSVFVFLALAQLAVVGAAPSAHIAEKAFGTFLFLTVVSYFAAIWSAARNLRRVELGRIDVSWHSVLGTFFLEFYLPIGVWFMHGRIQRAVRTSPG